MRRWRITALVVVVAAIIATTLVVVRNDRGEHIDRNGSVALARNRRVAIIRTPPAWHIVYRLEERGDVVSTDRVWVRRPFDSRLETWSGPPPGRQQGSEQVATFGRRIQRASKGGNAQTLALPPGVPASDVRIESVLNDAVDSGLMQRREVRRVAGRDCQVYRSGNLLNAGALHPATENEHADSCIDEAGLVLEELLWGDGRFISRRVAVSVEEPPSLPDQLFAVPETPIAVKEGGGSVRPLVPGSRPPGDFYELDSAPAGFQLRGRYSVIPPQPENFGPD